MASRDKLHNDPFARGVVTPTMAGAALRLHPKRAWTPLAIHALSVLLARLPSDWIAQLVQSKASRNEIEIRTYGLQGKANTYTDMLAEQIAADVPIHLGKHMKPVLDTLEPYEQESYDAFAAAFTEALEIAQVREMIERGTT